MKLHSISTRCPVRRATAASALFLPGLLCLAGCAAEAPSAGAPAAAGRECPDILLISVDTLRADRLGQALAELPERGLAVFPLWPKAGEPAKRVIVQARKGSHAPFTLLPGLVLHQANGAWTPEADDGLRRGNPLALSGGRL